MWTQLLYLFMIHEGQNNIHNWPCSLCSYLSPKSPTYMYMFFYDFFHIFCWLEYFPIPILFPYLVTCYNPGSVYTSSFLFFFHFQCLAVLLIFHALSKSSEVNITPLDVFFPYIRRCYKNWEFIVYHFIVETRMVLKVPFYLLFLVLHVGSKRREMSILNPFRTKTPK